MSSDYTAPHWERSALVLVDVQQDFLDGPAAIAGTAERVEAMAHLAKLLSQGTSADRARGPALPAR